MAELTLITTSQVAERCAVDGSTVRRWVASRVLVPTITTPGGHHRFDPESVDRLIESYRVSPPAA